MPSSSDPTIAALRNLPSVEAVLRTPAAMKFIENAGHEKAAGMVREAIEYLRNKILAGDEMGREELLTAAEWLLVELSHRHERAKLRRVINATGVVLHTNLGRAPLSEEAARSVSNIISGYCSVELDIGTGRRGGRSTSVDRLICELTGAEAAMVVNNCAAAAFIVLKALAAGGEVIVSRGELVEIGGDFRVPDVLEQSGAVLREVGTTNRTKAADYERAVCDATTMLLRVHPSNYRIVGFSATPDVADLAAIAAKHGLIFYEDIGSGAISDLAEFGITDEPLAASSLSRGVDIVTFSGDKLLGGPQCGIIAGRKELIETLRHYPLYRALRVDKMTYAALGATLESYARGRSNEIPVISMLSLTRDEIRTRAERLLAGTSGDLPAVIEIIDGDSAVGGGSAPLARLATALISIRHDETTADALAARFRMATPPVIGRIENDRFILDLRTVFSDEEAELGRTIDAVCRSAVAA